MLSTITNDSEKRVFIVAISHAVQAVFVFIKIKFLTSFFSLGGYAEYAILLSSMSVSISLANGGCDFLLTKKLVKAESRVKYLPKYFSRLITVTLLIIAIGAFFQALMFLFLSKTIDQSIVLFFATILFVIITTSNFSILSIYKGLNEINLYAKSYLLGSIANSLTQCLLVMWLSDSGVIQILIGSAFIQLLLQLFLVSTILKKYNLSILGRYQKLRISYIKSAISIAAAKSYTAGIGMLSQFILIFALSLLAESNMVALYYLYNGLLGQASNLVLIAVAGAFFPSLLRTFNKTPLALRDEIFSQTLIIVSMIFPLLFFMHIFQDTLLLLISTNEFISENNLLDLMICSVFLAVTKQSFDLSLQCHPSNKYFVQVSFMGNLTIIIIPSLLLYFYGVNAFGLGLIVNSAVWFILIPIISSKLFNYSLITKEIAYITLFSVFFILIILNSHLLEYWVKLTILIISSSIAMFSFFRRARP